MSGSASGYDGGRVPCPNPRCDARWPAFWGPLIDRVGDGCPRCRTATWRQRVP